MISDFAVMIAIVTFVAFDAIIGLNTPKLNVPEEFQVLKYVELLRAVL